MLKMSIEIFIYDIFFLGFELSFFSGVYGTGLGNTKRLGTDAVKYVGISGICIGIGEILGMSTYLYVSDVICI